MSEYIRTNKFDTNECPNIFVKEKLIRTNVRIYIRDQYIRIFEYIRHTLICIILGKQFEDTFENTWWRKFWWFCWYYQALKNFSRNFTSQSQGIFISLFTLDLEPFSFHFSFSISIARHFHFTFHSQNEWTRFLFHFSLLKLPISTLAGHWYVTKTVLRLVFNSSINFNHILPVAWLNWNWVYCKSFFCSWLWRKFEQMQPV